jgi:hypothetical protein
VFAKYGLPLGAPWSVAAAVSIIWAASPLLSAY